MFRMSLRSRKDIYDSSSKKLYWNDGWKLMNTNVIYIELFGMYHTFDRFFVGVVKNQIL